MSFEAPVLNFSLKAAADLSSLRFRAVYVDGSGNAIQQQVSGSYILGILQNKPTANQAAEIAMWSSGGVTKWTAGAAVPAGTIVTVDTSGRCIAWVTGASKLGYALTAAGAASDVISVCMGAFNA